MSQRIENHEEEIVIDLGTLFWNFLQGLYRFWWLIFVMALAGSAALYIKSSRFYTPMYRASASFTVMTGGSSGSEDGSYNFYYDAATAGQLAKTFPYILSSNLLTDAMKENMGTDRINGSISAQAVSDSNLITMTVTSTDAEDAKAILESAIEVYPDVSRFVIGDTRFYMIDVPEVSEEPYNQPSYTRKVLKGGLVGAAAGFLFLVLYAFFKRTVQKPDELKNVMSLPCIGNVPAVKFKARGKRKQEEISIFSKKVSQGFKENILTLQIKTEREMGGKILLVTSTCAGEGKSTLALNLAYAAASHGKKVLFIDGDLRKQEDRKRITENPGNGLKEVILEKETLEKAVEKQEKSGICFLCGSHPVKKIPSVLNSPKMEELLKEVKKEYDLILIDTPPAEAFEDAGIFSQYADGVLYVIRHDFVQKRRILDSISGLENSGAKILGYAFNCVPVHRGKYGYYGYGRYGYGYYGYGKYGYGEKGSQNT